MAMESRVGGLGLVRFKWKFASHRWRLPTAGWLLALGSNGERLFNRLSGRRLGLRWNLSSTTSTLQRLYYRWRSHHLK
jgi:hypothetical protein